MLYDSTRDFYWLIIRPWIWIPRILQIAFYIIVFVIKFITSRFNTTNGQKKIAEDLFITLTKLGPCFIKVGQALSTRPDLISKEWLEELTNLQDNLPAFNHIQAKNILKDELGNQPDKIFNFFPDKPIASASLGIVYKARLHNGEWVAVKIQRPNLRFIIRRDLAIIRSISIIVGPTLPLNLGFGIGEIIDEFGTSLFEEIDYAKEAKNAEKFSLLFDKNTSISIPNVEQMYSSDKVITTSWVDGIKIQNKEDLEKNNINPKSIIRTAVISGIQQLLEFGYFHADPHPGNMFALHSDENKLGKISYVDFGMMDTISDEDRLTLTAAIVHLINKDFFLLTKDFQKLGFLSKDEDLEGITPTIKKILGDVLTKDVGSFNLKSVTDKFSELMYKYPFRVPSRFALIIRAVVSQEGLALRLDPSFKIIRFAYPYIAKRLLTEQNDEMINILMEIIFDKDDHLQVDRLEGLINVLVEESITPSKELIPVARDGMRLLISQRGVSIRKKLLLSLIKKDKINTSDIKALLKLLLKKFTHTRLFYDFKGKS